MKDPLEREVAVFDRARQLAGSERAAYLDQTYAGDTAFRQRVENLLRASEQAGAFLHDPAPGAQRAEGATAASALTVNTAARGEGAGDRIGHYKLLQQIGEGGCGMVYMAEQEEPVRRRVALKVIKLGMDTKSVIARFDAERQALAMMDHPNIARVFDAGATETGRPYFVMELVRGIKITDYCDEHNLPTKERLDLFIQVCHAVQHAHQKGIIHRDLKPSKILVASNDGVPVPKVIDFGIAKATQGRLNDHTLFTAFEQFIGTPAYMSPEQAELSRLDIDTRSDIYSLGVLLYELLTGVTLFDKEELAKAALDEIRRMIRETEPVKPSTRLQTLGEKLAEVAKHRHTEPAALSRLVRGDLDWIVMKCLEKDRNRRYETANGIALDVRRHLQQDVVSAVGPTPGYRFRKFMRRNRVAIAISALAGLVITSFITLSIIVSYQAKLRRALDQSRIARAEADALRKQVEATVSITKSNYARWLRAPASARILLDETTPHVNLCGLLRLRGKDYACFALEQATRTNFSILGVGESEARLVEVLGIDATNLQVTVRLGKSMGPWHMNLPLQQYGVEPRPLGTGAVWFAFVRAPLNLVLDAYALPESRILIRIDEVPHVQLTARMSTPKELNEAKDVLEKELACAGIGMVAVNDRLVIVGASAFLPKAELNLDYPSFSVPATHGENSFSMDWPDMSLRSVALLYAQIVGRTLVEEELIADRNVRIRASRNVTHHEAIQVLGVCLQLYGVKPVPLGDTLIRMSPRPTVQPNPGVKR